MRRITLLLTFFLGASLGLKAQNVVYYTLPNTVDTLVRWTAQDLSDLLTQATGNTWTYQVHSGGTLPTDGIMLHADSNMVDHRPQYCEIEGTSSSLYFHSKYARGLMYGVYEYLYDLGFRFFLPDAHWNVIPNISTPYAVLSLVKQPIASMREPMMNGSGWVYYPPDPSSQTIQEYYKYLYRNSMLSERQPQGHNESFDPQYISEITADPCYTAEYEANSLPTIEHFRPPNVLNPTALDIWARYIDRSVSVTYTIQDPILNSKDPYYNGFAGLEVADATRWGNTDTENCVGGASNWPTPSTQMNLLCNYTTEYLIDQHPDRNIQTLNYAYDTHSDTPTVTIHPNRHISFTRGYNVNGSDVGILHRWQSKLGGDMSKFMDYSYFNLGYGGIPPYTSKINFEYMLKRNRNWGCEGVMYETRASKFSTGIYWRTWNEFLKRGTDLDAAWGEFYNSFGAGAPMITELFDDWSNSSKHTDGSWVFGNRWRYPHWLGLVQEASTATVGETQIQKKLTDLKAYMHYMVLDSKLNLYWVHDTLNKGAAAEALIRFIAESNDRHLFIHGGMIDELVNRMVVYTRNDTIGNPAIVPYFNYWRNFFWKWTPYYYDSVPSLGVNPYQNPNGDLSPFWQTINQLDDAAVEALFQQDLLDFPSFTSYSLLNYDEQIARIGANQLGNKDVVSLKHRNYMVSTGGVSGYSVYAEGPTQMTIEYDSLRCDPLFGIVCGAQVRYNIVVDAYDEEFSQEFFISSDQGESGSLTFSLPRAGWYYLSFMKIDVGGAEFKIHTGNALLVDKNAKFPMYPGESHPEGNYPSFYVPQQVDRVYFSMYSHSPSISPIDYIRASTHIYMPDGNEVQFEIDAVDSNLFYFDTQGFDDDFWTMYATNGEVFDFVNISNTYFWLDSTNTMGAKSIAANPEFVLYPNPTNKLLNVEIPQELKLAFITIRDLYGRELLYTKVSSKQSKFEINVSAYSKGIYLIELVDQNGVKHSKRFVVD